MAGFHGSFYILLRGQGGFCGRHAFFFFGGKAWQLLRSFKFGRRTKEAEESGFRYLFFMFPPDYFCWPASFSVTMEGDAFPLLR